ncbi:hypothetical protein, partial [Enterobacter hormaechei]|uniref:hypothetical protein n=1 Tax=Enterobacter hormaechei TaxID=158836 RepID=UPI0013D1F014
MPTDRGQRLATGEPERQRALTVHGVPGVHCEIHQRRLELARVSPHVAWPFRHLGHDADARAGNGVQH